MGSRIKTYAIFHYSGSLSLGYSSHFEAAHTLDGYCIGTGFVTSHRGRVEGGSYLYTCRA